jgi:hypothetical protein
VVGKWWVLHGAATLRSLQGKWRHTTARVCPSRSSYTGLHCQAHLIDSLPCFCAGLKVWDPVGKCRRLRLLLGDDLLTESKGRGWDKGLRVLRSVQYMLSAHLSFNTTNGNMGQVSSSRARQQEPPQPGQHIPLLPRGRTCCPRGQLLSCSCPVSASERAIGRWAQLECSPEQRRGMASLLACHEENAHDEGDGGRAQENSSWCGYVGYTLRRGAR